MKKLNPLIELAAKERIEQILEKYVGKVRTSQTAEDICRDLIRDSFLQKVFKWDGRKGI